MLPELEGPAAPVYRAMLPLLAPTRVVSEAGVKMSISPEELKFVEAVASQTEPPTPLSPAKPAIMLNIPPLDDISPVFESIPIVRGDPLEEVVNRGKIDIAPEEASKLSPVRSKILPLVTLDPLLVTTVKSELDVETTDVSAVIRLTVPELPDNEFPPEIRTVPLM